MVPNLFKLLNFPYHEIASGIARKGTINSKHKETLQLITIEHVNSLIMN